MVSSTPMSPRSWRSWTSPKNWGGVVMALGLVFLGMNVMGEGMTPLR